MSEASNEPSKGRAQEAAGAPSGPLHSFTRSGELPEQPKAAAETLPISIGSDLPRVGSFVGPYQLLALIAEGGMGEVWFAEQKSPVRRGVALKLIKAGMDTGEVIARFESERQALALMNHYCIAKIFDAGSTLQGRPYFAMEFVPGLPICNYCDKHRLSMRDRLDLFVKVCEGVEHAHRKAIIHRDLKPSNILVAEVDGKPVPKIIDFGVAKAIAQRLTSGIVCTRVGSVIGTPEYMSPEQFNSCGEDIDTRTDVFSLGVILYELMVGEIPIDYRKLGFEEILHAIRQQDAIRPSARLRTTIRKKATAIAESRRSEPRILCRQLRGDLDAIALKALEKDRSRRYGSPTELAGDIGRYLNNKPVVARPAGFFYSSKKAFLRNKAAALSAAGLAVLVLCFAVTEAFQLRRITQERDRSDLAVQFMIDMFRVPHHGFGPGLSVTAEEILDKASKDVEVGYEQDPVTQARLNVALGMIYFNLGGSNPRAEAFLRNALRLQAHIKEKDDREMLLSTRALAEVMMSEGDSTKLAEAEKMLREILKSQSRVISFNNPQTLKAMIALSKAIRYSTSGPADKERLRESEALLRDALKGQRRTGGNDLSTRRTILDLAQLLTFESKYAEAESLAQEAVDLARPNQGVNDGSFSGALWNLARILDAGKNYSEAEQVGRELVELEKRFPPEEKVVWYRGMRYLLTILTEEGKYVEADSLGHHLLDLERNAFGPNHPRVAATIYQLACIAALSHQTDKALTFLGDALTHGLASGYIAGMAKDSQLNSIRDDPRFAALLARR